MPNPTIRSAAHGSPIERLAPEGVDRLIELVARSQRLVAFTGAGVSTESGIPDYRGPGGVWERQAPPTIGDFLDNPETRSAYWETRKTRYPHLASTQPNAGHRALAALEGLGKLIAVITQNIDGLHLAAGHAPDRVIELHGTAHLVRCQSCGRVWPAAEIQARQDAGEIEPICVVCGGPLRAATILFGEALPRAALDRAVALAGACDLMLVVGSSLIVHPAAQLPVIAKRSGAAVAILNRTETPLDGLADIVVRGESGPVLSAVVAAVRGAQTACHAAG